MKPTSTMLLESLSFVPEGSNAMRVVKLEKAVKIAAHHETRAYRAWCIVDTMNAALCESNALSPELMNRVQRILETPFGEVKTSPHTATANRARR